MNEFARILLRCYSDSWEDKVPGPRPRSEEEMPPSIKVTKLKLKQNFLRWAVIKHGWGGCEWFDLRNDAQFNNAVEFNSDLYLTISTMNLHWRRFEFQILKYIAFSCCFVIRHSSEHFDKLFKRFHPILNTH